MRCTLLSVSLLSILLSTNLLQGCVAYTIADTAVSVVATGVKTTAKVVGGAASLAVDATTPSDKDKEKLKALKRICDKNPDHHECKALHD